MMMTLGLKSFFHAEALTDTIRILDNLDIINVQYKRFIFNCQGVLYE